MTSSRTSRAPRRVLAVLTLSCTAQAAAAGGLPCIDPAAHGPAFRTLRYDETFCGRAVTASDPSWFSLKNMSLGNARVSVGGETRLPFEQVSLVRASLRGGVDESYVTGRALRRQ